jgi:hypothetical protein
MAPSGAVTVEDTGGAEIDAAAMAHMSLSTPEGARLHTVDFHNWVTVSNATGLPPARMARWRRRPRQGLVSRRSKRNSESRSTLPVER